MQQQVNMRQCVKHKIEQQQYVQYLKTKRQQQNANY